MEAAKEVTAFELLGLKTIQELVASEKIDCDFVVTRRCDVLYDKDHIAQVRAGHERLEKAGFFEGLNEKIGYTEGEDAEKVCHPLLDLFMTSRICTHNLERSRDVPILINHALTPPLQDIGRERRACDLYVFPRCPPLAIQTSDPSSLPRRPPWREPTDAHTRHIPLSNP